MSVGTGAPTLTLRVRRMAYEADGVLSVRVEDPQGADLPPWEPGAHLDVLLEPAMMRQYSLCSSPRDRRHYEIAVLLEPESRGGSRLVHERLRPGDLVQARPPRNHFPLVDAPGYLFVAGGIGVTPLLPMIEAVQAAGRRWRLLYAGAARAHMAFLDRLAVHDDRITLAAKDEGERLDLEAWFTHVRTRVPGAHVYCCGPQRMIDDVETRGAKADVPVHVERFHAPDGPPAGSLPAGAFQVELARTGSSFEVTPDTSVLDGLLALGFDIQNDCRDGICGSCVVGVLRGAVEHRDYVLTDKEKRECRQMMVCVSRCTQERLVLDL